MKATFGGSPRSGSRPNKSVTLGFVVTDGVWKEITVKAHDFSLRPWFPQHAYALPAKLLNPRAYTGLFYRLL